MIFSHLSINALNVMNPNNSDTIMIWNAYIWDKVLKRAVLSFTKLGKKRR